MLTRQPLPAAHTNGQAPYAAPPAPGGEVVTLSRPIEGHKGPITEIRLREPTADDWFECGDLGNTMLVRGGNGEPDKLEIVQRPENIYRWLVRLSGYDRAVIGRLPLGDLQKLVHALRMLLPGNAGN